MIVVLVGEEGAAALESVTDATELHAVGFVPDTKRPVAVHMDDEAAVALRVAPDLVIGGNADIWGLADVPADADPEAAPKRRGRPPKVKV